MSDNLELFFDFIASIISNLLASFAFVLFIAFVVPLCVVGATRFGWLNAFFGEVTLAVGWPLSGIWALLWYYSRRKDYKERIVNVAKQMNVSDQLFYQYLLPYEAKRALVDHIDYEIEQLLTNLKSILVGRLPATFKASTFLVLHDDGTFHVYSQDGHNQYSSLVRDVRPLTKSNSMAGQALEEAKCLVLRDCLNAKERYKRGIRWHHTDNQENFRGRAMAPVQFVLGDNKIEDIGVLCFDIKRPWLLNREDQEVLLIYADKIALLYKLCH